jgi:hypothetical protein
MLETKTFPNFKGELCFASLDSPIFCEGVMLNVRFMFFPFPESIYLLQFPILLIKFFFDGKVIQMALRLNSNFALPTLPSMRPLRCH